MLTSTIRLAHNEALTTLDFVSLLMKKDAPKQSSATMSQRLKEFVPVGELGFDKTRPPKKPDADAAYDRLVASKWTLKGLGDAADKLLGSAKILGARVEKETKYWEEVLDVSEKGWSVCRVPKQEHILGVRFGFQEGSKHPLPLLLSPIVAHHCGTASPTFYNRGFAPLRPNPQGAVSLGQGPDIKPKSLKIRIRNASGAVTQSSQVRTRVRRSERSLEAFIHQARDSLFDEELFYELRKEARTLLNHGVVVAKDHRITFPIDLEPEINPEKSSLTYWCIEIELVTLPWSQNTIPDAFDKQASFEAESMLLTLRILLTHAHRRKFRRRSSTPPAISDDQPKPFIYNVLRPLIGYVRHRSAKLKVEALIKYFTPALEPAGIAYTSKLVSSLPRIPKTKKRLSPKKLVSSYTGPQYTYFLLEFPMRSQYSQTPGPDAINTINIDIKSHFAPPTHGTIYTTKNQFPPSEQSKPHHFHQAAHLRDHLETTISRLLSAHVMLQSPSFAFDKLRFDASGDCVLQEKQPARNLQLKNRKQIYVQMKKGTVVLAGIRGNGDRRFIRTWPSEREETKTLVEIVEEFDDEQQLCQA